MGWVVNTTPWPLYPREWPCTQCIGGWLSPRAGLDLCGKSLPPPGFDPRTVQPVASHYNDYAIVALQSVVERFVPQKMYTRWRSANYSNEMEPCCRLLYTYVPVLLYLACFVIISYALIWTISKCGKWGEENYMLFQLVLSSSRPMQCFEM
jgi:hypothetical protein